MQIIRVHKEIPYAKRGEAFCLYAFRGILSSANNQVLNLLLVCVILLPRGIVAQLIYDVNFCFGAFLPSLRVLPPLTSCKTFSGMLSLLHQKHTGMIKKVRTSFMKIIIEPQNKVEELLVKILCREENEEVHRLYHHIAGYAQPL